MAANRTLRLHVEGMSCASCVRRLEGALAGVPGVTGAQVNLATDTATVTYLPGATTTAAIAAASARAGYPATEPDAIHPATHLGEAADRTGDKAQAWRHRALLAAALTLPVVVVDMGGHLSAAMAEALGTPALHLLQFALATLVLAGPGGPLILRGLRGLWNRTPDMNALVALGALAAWGYSVVATLAPTWLPDATRAVYFESAAVIVTLVLTGRWLEARARGRAGAAIRRLLDLQPRSAQVERDGRAIDVPLAAIRVGDILRVRPGERIAADAVVIEGSSFVDESMITGEPMPVETVAGREVTGGSVNRTGALRLRAVRVGADTRLAQIVRMVEEAQGAKLPIEALVDRITARFVPVVLVMAMATVAVWLMLGPGPGLGLAVSAGVAVLIIACPCAMGLATPTSILVGSGRAAGMGLLFRKGDALQRLQQARVIAFDKTGTLTEGRPALTDLIPAHGVDEDEVLRLTAAAEAHSEHPIAAAILGAAHARGLVVPEASDVAALPGLGLRAQVEGRAVLIGADRLFAAEHIDLGPLVAQGAAMAQKGRTPLYVAINGRSAAVIGVSDPVKSSTPAAIAALHAMGLRIAMISGDNTATAHAIAHDLGIDTVVAEVGPEAKVAALAALKRDHGALAFVGDGINDAPALAAADVGIAIGTGTDVAIESADVVLISGRIEGVVNAVHLSRQVMRNIRQNLAWAFGYNVLLIPVAAGILYPLNGMLLSPPLAAGAMALSSVFVVTNALRLRLVRPALPIAEIQGATS